MAATMISAHGITLKRNDKTIAEKFSIDILAGKIQALIGPNGCGKSTALSAIAGERDLYAGDISYDGLDLKALSIEQLAQRRSVVAQSQRYSLGFKVNEILEMATLVSGTAHDIETSIAALDIASLLDRKVTSLSGGEQQRVSIAMGLAQGTPYFLLDEPFSAQDVESVSRICNHLRKLADSGKGILVVAHMPDSDLRWCDEIVRFPTMPN
ncbi:MAG: ABC transporter ATP-binding protein [Actinobacteria bacterium]|nr:ABC transporter ATP-binding protein [Actinomycetota bacterium]